MLPSVNENSEQILKESNPKWYPIYLHLSGSTFLVSFTDPNKELFNVKHSIRFPRTGINTKQLKNF